MELSDGFVEVLETPTKTHQLIVFHLCNLLSTFLKRESLGQALIAPYPVRLRDGKFREPDILVTLSRHRERLTEEYADGADLVVEVLSADRRRDEVTKRREYAEAGIAEYWIVDPKEQRVTVLSLTGSQYAVHSEAQQQGEVRSKLLPGLSLDLSAIWEAAK